MSKKKVVICIVCGVTAAAVAAAALLLWKRADKTEDEVGENQRIAYAYVTSITGNEISYMEVEESVAESVQNEVENTEMAEKTDREKSEEWGSDSMQRPERGEAPEGMSDEMQRPERGEAPEGMSDEMQRPERGETEASGEGNQMQTVTAYIPVGTTVHTSTDTETTFLRLATGDLLKILLETNEDGKEIIEEIWMLQ